MISYFRAYFPAIPVKNNEAGPLLRHVAIDAVVGDLLSYLGVAPYFMAVQAMFGKCSQIPLRRVNVVAGQTSHG
jgi:hypothetical protein